MSKEQTSVLKGVAILFMIYGHLFCIKEYADACSNFLYIKVLPFAYILCRATNPVPFFLILGGYGMYCVWQKGDKHRWSRIWKLMLHYWIVLLVFVGIGYFLHPDRYPGGWLKVVGNVTAFDTSYNGEMWFLFPYVCLTLLSPLLFKFSERFRVRYILLVSFVISLGTSFIISRYGDQYLYCNMWAYNPFLIVHLSFAFLLGAMACKGLWFKVYGLGNACRTSKSVIGGG